MTHDTIRLGPVLTLLVRCSLPGLLLIAFAASAQGRLSAEQVDKRLDEIIAAMPGQGDQALSDLQAIREDAENAGDTELWGDWHIVVAFAHQEKGDFEQAQSYLDQADALYQSIDSEEGAVSVELVRGELAAAQGRFREAIASFETVIAKGTGLETEDPEDASYYVAAAHNSLGDAYTVVGDFAEALENIQAAYRIFDELGDEQAKSAAIGVLGNLYMELDAAERALSFYAEGAELDRARGDDLNVAINLYNMGRALTDLGRHEEARENYARSLELSRRIGNTVNEGYIYYGAGLSLVDEGKDADALESFEQAIEVLDAIPDEYMSAKVQLQIAGIEARAGRYAESNDRLEAALSVLEQNKAEKDLVEVHERMARNYAAQGLYQLAYEHALTQSEVMANLASEERARRTAHLRVQFDTERAETENLALEAENRLKAQLLSKEQRLNRIVLIGVLVLLLVAVALSYSIWRQKQLEASLTLLANTDDLTGLLNRRRLFELGHQEVHRALRYGHPIALLVLDMDDFKVINDRHGHAVGDVVLRRIASHVAGGLREEDWIGRYGGEEFVALLPHTDQRFAAEVAERIRKDVEELDLSGCSVNERLTISIGVAWLQGQGDSFELMIQRADAALYRAKASGRNRVVLQTDTADADSQSSQD